MLYCNKCGQQIIEHSNFCACCGNVVSNLNANVRSFVYEGKLHKCTNCGETIEAFVANCPTCGCELRDKMATSSVRELATKLEQIEAKREPVKLQNIFQKAYYANNVTCTDEQKINLIRNYAIPNTREDLLEFIILAESNIDEKLYNAINSPTPGDVRREIADAWIAKFEQAYQKSKIILTNDKEIARVEELYVEKKKRIRQQKMILPLVIVSPFLLLMLLAMLCVVLF